jgi:hypothetical protein
MSSGVIIETVSLLLLSMCVQLGHVLSAALTMYQRARKLHDLVGDPAQLLVLAEEQLEAYIVAMNSLALLEHPNAWILIPITIENNHEVRKSISLPDNTGSQRGLQPRKRRKLSKHIPESKFTVGKSDSELIELADIQYEYVLLSARLDLIRKDPQLLASGGKTYSNLSCALLSRRQPGFLLPPASIVLKLAQSNRFNTAMSTARSLNIDMTDLFAHLTSQCIRISRSPDSVM